MSELIFDANNTVLDRMENMSRTEAVELARAICAALGEEVHAAIWPGAVTLTEDGAALDTPLEGEILGLSAEALEYAAPELFWHAKKTPAADVYSIGLILYCALNGGNHPFYPAEGELGVKERAEALRRRMKGEALPPIMDCGKKLGAIIQKATAYDEHERYQTISELKKALDDCPVLPAAFAGFTPAALLESDPELAKALDEEMGTSFVAEAEKRIAAQKEYKVDKAFEEMVPPPPKKSKAPIIAIAVITAAVLIMLLCLKACQGSESSPQASNSPAIVSPNPTPEATTAPAITVTPSVTETPNVTATPQITPTPDVGESPPAVAYSPSPSPVVNTPLPANMLKSGNYTLVMENVSWSEAKAKCEAMGGHLAVIHNQAELNAVISMAEQMGASYVWLGAKRNTPGGEMEWVTGEKIDFYDWDLNEPSYKDGYDGTLEDHLLLWKVSFGDHSGWKYNDSRGDLYRSYPSIFGGKIAYICEF